METYNAQSQPTKVCNKCGVEYPATREFFYVRKENKCGLKCTCVKCIRERDKLHRKNNSEKFKAKRKKYREENIEKVRAAYRKWKAENPEKARESDRKYREENIEKIRYIQTELRLKKQIGAPPPPELVEIKVLINKTKQLCKTLKN